MDLQAVPKTHQLKAIDPRSTQEGSDTRVPLELQATRYSELPAFVRDSWKRTPSCAATRKLLTPVSSRQHPFEFDTPPPTELRSNSQAPDRGEGAGHGRTPAHPDAKDKV